VKKHWAADLVGKPWEPGASGPDSFDCWGLVRYVQKKYFDRHVPKIGFDRRAIIDMFSSTDILKQWTEITRKDSLVEGDCIIMSPSRNPIHVGVIIYIDNMFGVLHSIEPVGVIYVTMSDLSMSGWITQRLYRWSACSD